ncbi:hypothetical protein AVEN_263865-1, partial [Araneus ventricosus]
MKVSQSTTPLKELKENSLRKCLSVLKNIAILIKTLCLKDKFFSCKQREGQTFDNYLTQLKTLVTTCDFGDQQESLIRDRMVLGINDSSLQERMLREPSLTLQKAAEFVRAAEASKEQFQSLKGFASSSCVNAVKTSVFKKNYK